MMFKSYMWFLLFICCSFSPSGYVPKEDKIVFETMNKTVEIIKKKYNMDAIGYGMNGKFEYLEISFQSFQKCTKDIAREMVVDCVKEFQSQINSNENLKPYLKNFPFTMKNVGICIYFRNINGKDFIDPDICVASSNSRGVDFKTNDPEKEYAYKNWYEESHEEALALVEKTKHLTAKDHSTN